ncbi:MAG: prolipoprotein diacylglyceryl transferase [Chitinophagales bacterium]
MLFTSIQWNPDPTIFTIGNFSLQWYGLMWGMAVLGGYFSVLYMLRRSNLTTAYASKLVEYIFFGSLIGARLGHIFFYDLEYFLAHPIEIFKVWNGGLASHGGGIGVLIATYLFIKNYKFTYLQILDILVVSAPLCAFLGRIGNLMNSEIVGKYTEMPWGFVFLKNGDALARHPSQLYEAIMFIACFGLMIWLSRRRPHFPVGFLSVIFFMLIPTLRFLLEFFKQEATYTQLLSLPYILFGVFLLFYIKKMQNISTEQKITN